MEGFQRGRAQSWHEPRFYLRRFIGGFFMWGVPISWHVPRFYLLILADVVRFPSAFGPWWACHFPFFCVCVCFFLCFFSREISKHQVSRRTPYPYNNAAADSNRRECAHCCCWGWFWVLMRAPACLEPSLKSEIWGGGVFRELLFATKAP